MTCHFPLQGILLITGFNSHLFVSCTGNWILRHYATWEALICTYLSSFCWLFSDNFCNSFSFSFLFLSFLVIWWLYLVLYLDSFFFCLCIYYRLLVCDFPWSCISLVAFKIPSLSLIFFILITMCLSMDLFRFILYRTLCSSWTWMFVSFSQWEKFSAIQFSSVTQSCPTLCNPMDCSMPGFPVHYQLPELAQTHVHWVSDAIQPTHPLSSPSPPAFNLSQHQGLFKWVSSSHQVNKVLELQLQHQSFQWIFRTDFLSDGLVGSPCSPRDSQESSPTPQFKSINSLALSFL